MKQAPRAHVQILIYVGLVVLCFAVLYPVMLVCKKAFEPGTRITPVVVNGQTGFFLSGARHFLYMAPTRIVLDERIRLARNTLLWEHGPLTLRLEGDLSLAEALRIARSFR